MIANTLNEQLCQAKKSRNHKSTYAKFERQLSKLKLKGFVDVTLKLKHVKVKLSDGSQRNIRTYQAAAHKGSGDLGGKLGVYYSGCSTYKLV